MIEHIVLFRCKADCTAETKQAIVKFALSMKAEIPEILTLSAGENWSERSDGFELGLVARFQNKTTLDVYQKHPYHQRFVTELVRPNVEKVLAVDYDIPQ